MANLNGLNQKVAALSKTQSNDFEFMDVLDAIEEAADTPDEQIDELRNILDRYRFKLHNRETLDRERVRAKDLAEAIMLDTVSERLDRIKARNDALSALTDELQGEIEKANSDARLLTEIKEAVDKATKTVEEVKGLISQLTATDSSVTERIDALIERLGNISSIFEPQNV